MSKKNAKKLSVIITGLILFAIAGFVGSLNVSQAEATTCSVLQNQTSCLDNSNCYWDQQYDNCRTYDSTKQTCSDPDNGKDIYTQAHTYGFRESFADERDKRIRTGGKDACIEDKLREHYCANDYYIRTYDVECPNGCENGACKRDETTCTDTDGGKDYYTKGTVTGKTINPTSTVSYNVITGEEEIDASNNFVIESLTDYCSNPEIYPSEEKLIEYYCKADGTIGHESFKCPNGCKDGACIKDDEPYCSAIGSRSEGWYQTGSTSSSAYLGLIKYDNCDGCYAICKTIDSSSEGWYSSCDGKLIKYDNCKEEEQTCDEKCKSFGYESGMCRNFAISPEGMANKCESNEININEASDCILPSINGQTVIGVGITCCCKNLQPSSCLPDGTLIKLPNDPKIYVIINCEKKWIETIDEFNQGGYKWEDVKETNSAVIDAYAKYCADQLEVTANLLRAIGHNKVYRIVNGKSFWIPTIAAFNAQGLKWEIVQDVPETEVNQYPRLKLAKLANKPEVYYLTENGSKRHIPSPEVFNSYGNKWENVVEISSSELNAYLDSVLIKAENDYKIYKLENNKKRWIKTARAFNRLGYDWNQVSSVNDVEIGSYTSGTSIE